MKMKMRKMVDDGFTLIELLVVVLIIGVLSGIVVLAVSNSTATANAKACKADASTLLTALDNYAAQSSPTSYPTAAAAAETSGDLTGYKPYTEAELKAKLVPAYIKSIPTTVTGYVKPASGSIPATVAVATTGADCGGIAYVGLQTS